MNRLVFCVENYDHDLREASLLAGVLEPPGKARGDALPMVITGAGFPAPEPAEKRLCRRQHPEIFFGTG
ncbi:MAG: hypothetical protein ABSA45_13385 [Verrucomicrobiota bacterium]